MKLWIFISRGNEANHDFQTAAILDLLSFLIFSEHSIIEQWINAYNF